MLYVLIAAAYCLCAVTDITETMPKTGWHRVRVKRYLVDFFLAGAYAFMGVQYNVA